MRGSLRGRVLSLVAVVAVAAAGAGPAGVRSVRAAASPDLPEWTRTVGGSGNDEVADVFVDDTGIYVTGTTFSPTFHGQPTSNVDAYLQKYDASGRPLWSRLAVGAGTDFVESITVDADAIWTVGNTTSGTPGGASFGFLDEFDHQGTHVARRLLDPAFVLWGVATDATGVYVAGHVKSGLGHPVAGGVSTDAFVARYDKVWQGGVVEWIRYAGGTGPDVAWGLFANGAGVYLAGDAGSDFGGETRTTTTNAFLQRYLPDGTLQWTRFTGPASGNAFGRGTAADATQVVISGTTHGAFGSQTPAGTSDAFARSYDLAGNLKWTSLVGGPGADEGLAVDLDSSGIYLAGIVTRTDVIGGTAAFAARHSLNGALRQTRRAGGTGTERGQGIEVHRSAVYLVGSATSGVAGETSVGATDGFVQRHSGVLDHVEPTTGAHAISIRRNGQEIQLRRNGALVMSGAASAVGRITVTGSAAADTLTLDHRGGSISPSSGVRYAAGGGSDRVIINGGGDWELGDAAAESPVLAPVAIQGVELGTLIGGPGHDTLDASAFSGAVTLDGGAGNDVLTGGPNKDLISGRAGDDTVDGGGDTDTLSERADVDFRLSSTFLVGGLGVDELTSVEHAQLVGGESDNAFDVSGWSAVASLDGVGGEDIVRSRHAGITTLQDTFLARNGRTTVGITRIERGVLVGGDGADTLDASAFTRGSVTLVGGRGNDTLRGSRMDDLLLAGSGLDTVAPGLGNDEVDGGPDRDGLSASGSSSLLLSDSLLKGLGEDMLSGVEEATLIGAASNDLFDASGFSGALVLEGNGGNDTLIGGGGTDRIVGGPGADTARGNAGNDVFVMNDGTRDPVVDGGAGTDSCSCDAVDVRTSIP